MKSRNIKIDIIKTIAIIFVVGIHVLAPALRHYYIYSKSWIFTAVGRTIVAPAVPLFFMCSGALLFKKDKEIKYDKILKKYIPRITIPLFFWATIYEFIQMYYRTELFNLSNDENLGLVFRNIFTFKHNYQLYYIYIMMVFYLMTPIIKAFIKNVDNKEIKVALTVWFFLGILTPTLSSIPVETIVKEFEGLIKYIALPMGYASVGYGLLGYYIDNNKKTPKHYLIILIIANIVDFAGTYYLYEITKELKIMFWGGMSVGVMLQAYGVFGLIETFDIKIKHPKIFVNISNASFAIFLCHDVFLRLFAKFGLISEVDPVYVTAPLTFLLTFTASYLLYLLINKTKYLKKYII